MVWDTTKSNNFSNSVKTYISSLLSNHLNIRGSSEQFGHVKAGGVPQQISTSAGAAGTDNGYYARADHVHKVTIDDNPTQNSTNPVASGGVYAAIASIAVPDISSLETRISNLEDEIEDLTEDFLA